MPTYQEQPVSVDGVTLNVASGPNHGPPLLLLHGVGRRWQDFGPLLPALGSRWQVQAPDHRGHGRSARAERYLVADYVADAVALLRTLDQPAFVIGHSLGALTALGVAAALPDRVRGIVLEDPPSSGFLNRIEGTAYALQWAAMRGLSNTKRPDSEIARALADIRFVDGTRLGDRRDAVALRFLARCLADLDPAVLTPVLECRWLEGFDPLAAAASIKCPALLLAADTAQGGMLPPADADALAAALADSLRINMPGVGHLIHAQRPDLFLQYVVNFLDSF